ncbi:unnamed protein product, partial [Cyprideis torosa]
MKPLLVLIGYRAVGKTTIGRELAHRLGYAFLDTDSEVQSSAGKTIADIVEQEGWPTFRRLEKEVLTRLCSLEKTVVASGGGAILHSDIWPQIKKKGHVLWLSASPEVICQRIAYDQMHGVKRPSLLGEKEKNALDEVVAVLKERLPLYADLADKKIHTEGRSRDDLVEEIA